MPHTHALSRNGTDIIFDAHVTLDAPVSDVWAMFTTTAGLARWFPQINADRLGTDREMDFNYQGEYALLKVLDLKPEQLITFTWDTATMTFTLTPGDTPSQTVWTMHEVLPPEFSPINRDVAGWSLHLDNVQAMLAGETFNMSDTVVAAREQLMQSEIDAL